MKVILVRSLVQNVLPACELAFLLEMVLEPLLSVMGFKGFT